jgi:L-threonylcarbamoyladenylate synthase
MAEIIKITEKNLKKAIEKAAGIIKNGGAIVYPTDTLYGLGVNALDEKSVEKVFEIKGRNYDKPISIAVSDLTEVKKYAEFTPLAVRIAKKFLPGPLTLILPSRNNLPKQLNPDDKVRIRIPDNGIALEIIKKSGVPLTATSANLSGGKDPINAKEAVRQIGDKIDFVLDAGRCKYRKGSTIVKIVDGKIEIIREGVIPRKKLIQFSQKPI